MLWERWRFPVVIWAMGLTLAAILSVVVVALYAWIGGRL